MDKLKEASVQLAELNQKLAEQKIVLAEKTEACEALLAEIALNTTIGKASLLDILACHSVKSQLIHAASTPLSLLPRYIKCLSVSILSSPRMGSNPLRGVPSWSPSDMGASSC